MTKIILTEENSILEILEFKKVWINQIKEELQKTVDFSKSLEIKDFEDKKQFELIKSTKNWYVKTRNTIKRAFKSKRDEYNALSKENLEAEREVISVIEWEEKRLDDMVNKAELLKLRKDNESKLEERKTSLKQYESELTDDELLEMSDKDFNLILSTKKEIYLAKKEAELKEKEEKIAREKELEEAKKQARLEAEQEAERKHKSELEQIKREQEAKELAEKKRKEDEEKARLEAEQTEKDNQARLEKEKEYIAYRDSLDYDKFEKEDWKIVFYKKVWEFKI